MQLIRYTFDRYLHEYVFIALILTFSGFYAYNGNTDRAIFHACFATIWAVCGVFVARRELRKRSRFADLLEAADFGAAQDFLKSNLSAFTREEVRGLQTLFTRASLSPAAVKSDNTLDEEAVTLAALRGEKP